MPSYYPIVYVRGYAGTQSDVEETVDDPTYGFNSGSTHIRFGEDGKADMFMFVSPFARLFRDHGYADVIDGATQRVPPGSPNPERTIWIYRYYDPTSNKFDRPGGRRLSIEEAARGLRDIITQVLTETQAKKVYLVAHSMGGLVCRSLIQKVYPENNEQASNFVDKLFTYGTPHGGIHFDVAGGKLLEKLRDAAGVNDANNFGPQRMYEFLTKGNVGNRPNEFDSRIVPNDTFSPERIFCIVGTNAADYAVAAGLSRAVVGPQSDGLVQIESAYVKEAPRAYIHRSHSGRYGMVNSEEGYQNLQRFLFGDVTIKAVLCDFGLKFDTPQDTQVTYLFETQVAVRGMPILMHERTLRNYSAESLNRNQYEDQMARGGLPLFTNFLRSSLIPADGTMRYMIRLAVFKQTFRNGLLIFGDHLERLPLWSDYLIVALKPKLSEGRVSYDGFYNWASIDAEPKVPMPAGSLSNGVTTVSVPLPDGKARDLFGANAKVTFAASQWH
jgi:hypothetical protein